MKAFSTWESSAKGKWSLSRADYASACCDGYHCRVCDASGRNKRTIIVHHRRPGRSVLNLMLSLCPSCHAKVDRTRAVLSAMPSLLLESWREQHPEGYEQVLLEFTSTKPAAKLVPLFGDERELSR